MSPLGIVLVVILVLILVGGLGGGTYFNAWPYGYGGGHYGVGLIGVLLIILLVFLLAGETLSVPAEVLLPLDRSWSWTLVLDAAVNNNDTIEIPTPDYNPAFVDPQSAQLSVNEAPVVLPQQATVSFTGATALVTNLTGTTWLRGAHVYVYAKVKPTTGEMLQQISVNQGILIEIEARMTAIETRSTSNEAMLADHEARITTIEDQMGQIDQALIPHVTSQYYDSVSLAAYAPENRVQMVASNNPDSWEIVFETNNNIPTPGYWVVDGGGAVALLPEGAAAFAPGDVTVVQVRATNANGHGDGSLTMHLTA